MNLGLVEPGEAPEVREARGRTLGALLQDAERGPDRSDGVWWVDLDLGHDLELVITSLDADFNAEAMPSVVVRCHAFSKLLLRQVNVPGLRGLEERKEREDLVGFVHG